MSNLFIVSDHRSDPPAPPTVRITLDVEISRIAETFTSIDDFVWFYKTMRWDDDIENNYFYKLVKNEFEHGATSVYYIAAPNAPAIESEFTVSTQGDVSVIHGDEMDVVETILGLHSEI